MKTTMIYRPQRRGSVWIAFTCALIVHLGVVLVAANKSDKVMPQQLGPADEVVNIEDGPAEPPREPEAEPLSEPTSASPTDDSFVEENVRPIQRRKKPAAAPIPHSTAIGLAGASRYASVKNLLLSAPRPAYPYEARERHVTGSGLADLTINVSTGSVIEARMRQSTGSPVLDNATLSAFRRWRFRSGAAANIEVPITYTLTGASY